MGEESDWAQPGADSQMRAGLRAAWERTREGVFQRHLGWWVALVSLSLALWFSYAQRVQRTGQPEVYVLDPRGNVYFGVEQSAGGNLPLFRVLASDAALTFFQRSPAEGGSLDRSSLARRLYGPRAHENLLRDLERQRPDINNRELHQKAEIQRIRQLEERSGSVFVLVEGQLIRAGRFSGAPVAEAVPFSLVLRFVRNESLEAGSPPWRVAEWARQLPDDY